MTKPLHGMLFVVNAFQASIAGVNIDAYLKFYHTMTKGPRSLAISIRSFLVILVEVVIL
jgi:hypothetical protein